MNETRYRAVIQEQLPLGNLYSILYKAQQTAKDATWHISNMKNSKQILKGLSNFFKTYLVMI